jgi:hypothetical protein
MRAVTLGCLLAVACNSGTPARKHVATEEPAADGSSPSTPSSPAGAKDAAPGTPVADAPRAADAPVTADVPRTADAATSVDVPRTADAAPVSAFNVTTHRYGNARLGWNAGETALTPAAVMKPDGFGKLFSRNVKGQVWAMPLYLSGLQVTGKARQNALVVATASNVVYAFNADDPAAGDPLWMTDLGTPAPYVPMSSPDFAAKGYCWCTDFMPEVGITATPVIDLKTGTLYVVSKHYEAGFVQRLHALDLTTGKERTGSPVVLAAAVPGTGDTTTGGMIRFDPQRHLNRSALLLAGGALYIAFASHGDTRPWFGWVLAYDAATLKQVGVWNSIPNGYGAGIWMSGSGPAADDQDNVYFSTGNGATNPDPNNPQLGEAVVKLTRMPAGLRLADWYVAGKYKMLDGADLDLGSSAVLLLPKGNLLIAAGKEGVAHVLDRTSLGKYSATDAQVVQILKGDAANDMTGKFQKSGFVYWEGPAGPMVYTWPKGSKLLGFKLNGAKFDAAPALSGAVAPPGGDISISSNGAAGGVVWGYDSPDGNTATYHRPGRLRAFDATTLAELWSSDTNKARDQPGEYVKYGFPMVANGRVHVITLSGRIDVYGLR